MQAVDVATQSQLSPQASSRQVTFWRRFARNRLAVVGLGILIVFYVVALLAPLISRYPPDRIQAGYRDRPPSAEHWLGTDRNGRDVYARLIVGARISLSVGLAAVAIIMSVGVVLGALAGYFGGWVDMVLMRLTDVLLTVPQLLLLIVAAALFSPGLPTTIVAIGLTSWPGTARLVRGEFLTLKQREFITAARALGASTPRIIFLHLFPNAIGVIVVQATLWLSYAVLLEASLSYLGLGVQIPTPSWGNMLQDGQRELLNGAWWLTVFPGLAIFLFVLAFNLVGDGLRDALDPRLRRR